jgi:hypothetical protein
MKLNYKVCRMCSSFMQTHPETSGWLKCPSCGFCKIEKCVITQKDYLMGRDVQFSAELTPEILLNITILLEKVNSILWDLKIDSAKVSSGWRPAGINSSVPNAAKRSLHMTGKAIDILDDKSQSLANKILTNPDLLKKYDLWLEDPAHTKGKNTNWVHLDMGNRTERPLRMFKP